MNKFVRASLIIAVFGMLSVIGLTGCDSDSGGNNESEALQKAGNVKGTVDPNAPKSADDYQKAHKR